jgi:hypothetical protein
MSDHPAAKEIVAAAAELQRVMSRAAELIGQLTIAANNAAHDADQLRTAPKPAKPDGPRLIGAAETAGLLGVNIRMLDALERRGELCPIRVGDRAKRWIVADVEAYVASRQQATKTAA